MVERHFFYPWRPHPWHGLEVGDDPPRLVHAYIEITPFDPVKYEIDKTTGYLRVDRPQRSSSLPPALYGFIPRTYCADRVGALNPQARRGDGDPLDVCVISERPISRPEVVLDVTVLGGIQMIDHEEADDKIIAVLRKDAIWGGARDIAELPEGLVDRLEHYFATYKMLPGEPAQTSIIKVFDAQHAGRVIEAAMLDYLDRYGEQEQRMAPQRRDSASK